MVPSETFASTDFDSVMRDHAGLFARIARSFEANEQNREDLLQDILLAVWRALPSFRQQSSVRTFVASVAHKCAVSHVRVHSRRTVTTEFKDDVADDKPRQDDEAIQNDLRRKLTSILATLPEAQRETAVLLLEGFAYSEIAVILGISINAATLRCQRARAYLLESMKEA